MRPLEHKWRQLIGTTSVAGVQHRTDAVGFCLKLSEADENDTPYGCLLIREPMNPHDPKAIRVEGWIDDPFASVHLGFLNRDLASGIDDIQPPLPIAGEFQSFSIAEDGRAYLDLVFSIPGKKDAFWADSGGQSFEGVAQRLVHYL